MPKTKTDTLHPDARPECGFVRLTARELSTPKSIALQMHLQGYGVAVIAESLSVSREVVTQWATENDG